MRGRFVWMLVGILISVQAQAQDAQWRGANRDGKYKDTGLLKQWPEEGPELLLKKEDLGIGYSTPIIYEENIYISGRRDSVDVLTRLDMNGQIKWKLYTVRHGINPFLKPGVHQPLRMDVPI